MDSEQRQHRSQVPTVFSSSIFPSPRGPKNPIAEADFPGRGSLTLRVVDVPSNQATGASLARWALERMRGGDSMP